MKTFMIILLTALNFHCLAQVMVTVQLPPNGLVQKTQLWNLSLTNTGTSPKMVHLEMMFSDAQSGQQVFSGVSKVITVVPGMTQSNSVLLGPIQYNILSTAFYIDPGPAGLLPAGSFNVCYSVMEHSGDAVDKIGEECVEVLIEPLAPPALQFPYDGAILNAPMPIFTWLAPMPVFIFTNLRYDLELVEIFSNQSAADAMQQNIPMFRQSDISVNSFAYPMAAPSLEKEKNYAWRVIARSYGAHVGTSQTWSFSLKEYQQGSLGKMNGLPYVKLSKGNTENFTTFYGTIKFDYTNETADTVWSLKMTDLSSPNQTSIAVPMDSIALRRGQNLVRWDPLAFGVVMLDKHLYLLELTNSRQETWRLRFEYRKEN